MAAVHPDAVAVVAAATPHHVVAVVCLRDLEVGIDDDLRDRDGGRVSEEGGRSHAEAGPGSPGRRSPPA